MGKKKNKGGNSQGFLVDILSSMMDGSVPPALITAVYVCLILVLFIGVTGLYFVEASLYYYFGLILIIVGFFISFSWYISESDLGSTQGSSKKKKKNKST